MPLVLRAAMRGYFANSSLKSARTGAKLAEFTSADCGSARSALGLAVLSKNMRSGGARIDVNTGRGTKSTKFFRLRQEGADAARILELIASKSGWRRQKVGELFPN